MKYEELQELETAIAKEVIRRRQLGGYSMEADGLLSINEAILKIVTHLMDIDHKLNHKKK